ncbi:HAD family hydrolase [Herbidospora mongoliensis]|uniref:HAD family hydrolase n=1 Tax=Herbidospora mongoliensis TaxID=688067 RepID=UPI000837783C|nr:HAD family phosphatase [Herbidospora mongoliensis]
MSETLHAVLFDMDGLLVDTEKVWGLVEAEVVDRLGGQWSPEHQERMVGGSWETTVSYMLGLTGADVPHDVVAGWLLDGMLTRLESGVEPLPGALELLTQVKAAGVPIALVTASLKPMADAVLASIGRHHFDVIVTADDVTRTKPDPEPYQMALRLLGVDPHHAVVFEDSPNGVAAATAAGCYVVAVPNLVPIPAASRRTVVESLLDVDLPFIRTLVQAAV